MLRSLYTEHGDWQTVKTSPEGTGNTVIQFSGSPEIESTFDLVKNFLKGRDEVIKRNRSRVPLSTLDKDQGTGGMDFSQLCLKRKMEMKKETDEVRGYVYDIRDSYFDAISFNRFSNVVLTLKTLPFYSSQQPEHLITLLSHIDDNIASLKTTLVSLAAIFAASTTQSLPTESLPPLVHHDEGITLITNRLMLWERLQNSVGAVNDL